MEDATPDKPDRLRVTGPAGWHAVVVDGELFGLFPRLEDAQRMARRLSRPSRQAVVVTVTDGTPPISGGSDPHSTHWPGLPPA